MRARLMIEQGGSSDFGPCPCCGDMSRNVWGFVYSSNNAYAAYNVQWTINQVPKHGAHLDIIIGRWGDAASAADRSIVSLTYAIGETGPFLTVIDAHGRKGADETLAKQALRRSDVIGKPVAKRIFAICDAVLTQDDRLGELPWGEPR